MIALSHYVQAREAGDLQPDAAQSAAAQKLEALRCALTPKGLRLFSRPPTPKGIYLWGDVGRGKTLLMDMFFEDAPGSKERLHFNAFMTEIHARIHSLRQKGASDPIVPVARAIARKSRLLCFDEFQVTDVADAMILGRLFEQFFAEDMVIVATSNIPPNRLYEGGLNRQLFLPFIEQIKAHMELVALNGPHDYRLQGLKDVSLYRVPLSPQTDAAMDETWIRVAGGKAMAASLTVLGRVVVVPLAGRGAARFSFEALCSQPLGAADYLAIARNFHTVFIDHIPHLTEQMADAARRFTLLIDTLYDQGVKLVCSAAVAPEALYPKGSGAESFRRTASRLVEMQTQAYLAEGHGRYRLSTPT